MISGMYLGDLVRRVLLSMAQECALFGPCIPHTMLEAFSFGYTVSYHCLCYLLGTQHSPSFCKHGTGFLTFKFDRLCTKFEDLTSVPTRLQFGQGYGSERNPTKSNFLLSFHGHLL